ncbi:MAG: hypothetical protein ACRELE_03825, partial [Gemmatimonadales bacterium]
HFVADIGGLPVYTTVVTTFSFIPSIGFEGQAMVQSGLTVTAGLTMGAAYDNGQWTSLTGPNGGITIKPLTITVGGKVIATLGVKAESQFYVYGVSGPYVWAKPFFEADADIDLLRATYTSSCRTAINAGVGMYVKVFDLTLINFVQDADFLGTSWDSCKRTASLSASGVLAVASGNNQSAAVGLILPSQIVALVTSLSGAPVAGVTIVFATPDGGVVQPSAAVTNASGRAAASWTLGSVPGTQTATATAVGYSGSPGTFSALATNTASCPPLAYTLGQTVTGAITGSSCQYFNTQQSFDNYALTLATPQLLQFYMLAPFQAYASVNIDPAGGVSTGFPAPNSGTPVLEKVIAPAGNLYLRPAAYNVGSTGPYTFTVTPISSDITGCEKVVIMAGAVASQQLTSTDCTEGGHYSDRYLIALGVGWTAHITMRSTAFDAFLGLYYDFNDSFLTSDDDSGGGTDAQIVYTNTTNDILNYFIVATSARAGAQGAYTLTLTITEPSSLHAGDASPSRAGASIVPVPH